MAAARLRQEFVAGEAPSDFIARFSCFEPTLKMSDLGWFLAESEDAYENQVHGILSDLVWRPVQANGELIEVSPRKSRFNNEIAKELNKINILARKHEGIEDHKVKRNFAVSEAESLVADFAVKSGVYHVTSTLDLRKEAVHIKEAGWKACVLFEARRCLGKETRRFGVYAAAHDASQFRPHISLLNVHSDKVYNWMNPEDQYAYRQAMLAAVQVNGNLTEL